VHTGRAYVFSGTALRRSRYHSSMVPPKHSTRHRSLSAGRLSPAGCPLLFSFLVSLLLPADSSSQGTEGWNNPRALEFVARARELRQSAAVDPDLRAYQAIATGHVFFLVDRPSSGVRTLVKADQLALEIYWRGPRDTRQRIIGMRDQKVLPTNIRYHLDHLTVVQDDFGDQIRIGDGDEVAAVVHPVSSRSEEVYDFRLADSLTISFAGSGGEVRVYEIQVRPRDSKIPGFVGSVFIDRAAAAIVRMTFTFTPASYVGREIDYIRISLDNSLWESKWWLPYRQELEIRRELPRLDFLVGSVIRGRFEIGDYEFNPDLADDLFMGPRVTVLSETQRESYPFTEPLIPEAGAREIGPAPTLEEVRTQALSLMKGHYMSGLTRLRLHLRSASEVFRWNRAEGATPAFGFSFRPSNGLALQTHGGWSFGRGEPTLMITLIGGEVRPTTGIALTWNKLRDLGLFSGPSGALNTLAGLTGSRDWTDPWLSSGVEAFRTFIPAGAPTRVALRWERHEAGVMTVNPADAGRFRPVRPVDEGDLMSAEAQTGVAMPGNVSLAITGKLSRFEPAGGGEATRDAVLVGALAWARTGPITRGRVMARLDGGVVVGKVITQHHFLLGGAGTLLGHPFRSQVGDRFWLARLEADQPLLPPWISLRAFAAAGAATFTEDENPIEIAWEATGDAGIRASAGLGVGLGWDVVRLDLGRGMDGGKWELVFSVDRRFKGWL
jgi:hypothetical protein